MPFSSSSRDVIRHDKFNRIRVILNLWFICVPFRKPFSKKCTKSVPSFRWLLTTPSIRGIMHSIKNANRLREEK